MEKKDTALTQVIEFLQTMREEGETDLRSVIRFCEKKMSVERSQILGAYQDGIIDSTDKCELSSGQRCDAAENYFTKTYN